MTSLASKLSTLCLLALACSSPPDDPPVCIDDSLWIVNVECEDVCPVDGYSLGSCAEPVSGCVRVHRGDVFSVTRMSDMPEPTEAELGVRECE